MGTRSRRADRCDTCRMHTRLCVCAEVPTLPLRTRVELVAHKRELTKTTATGPLALQALPNSRLHVHGHQDAPVQLDHLADPAHRVLLLFPADDARVLSAELLAEDDRPVLLVVPEGSWRQASRMARRLPHLEHAEAVVLPEGAPSQYAMRHEPKDGGMATFEAIARALGILEGPEVQQQLEDLFDLVVTRTMWSRQVTPDGPPR